MNNERRIIKDRLGGKPTETDMRDMAKDMRRRPDEGMNGYKKGCSVR